MLKVLAFTGAALALLAGGAAVAAGDRPETATMTVTYADLDLSGPAGRAVLERRINMAVERVCPRADNRDVRGALAVRDCRDAAITSARQQMTTLYAKRQYAQSAVKAGSR